METTFLAQRTVPPPILVNALEAARRLSISARKLWSLTKSGEIPSLKIGKSVRYRVADLEAWTEQKVNAPTTCAIKSLRSGV